MSLELFLLEPETTYFNHGAFGSMPRVVWQAQQAWREKLAANPQRFLSREQEWLLEQTADRLGQFVGCGGDDLLLVDNATVGMNLVASTVPLESGDNVVLTTHEYGAVKRIWQQTTAACQAELIQATLPEPITTAEDLVEHLFEQVNSRTKLIVISHVTSPTAIVLPVQQICARAQQRGIPVCIDGPHAIAMRPLEISELGCDFYAASCHKWLCGPTGSGFLYVDPRWQQKLKPTLISWGGTFCGRPKSWKDEFLWQGTRDLSACLSLPAAIDFFEQYGLANYRQQTHSLAQYARRKLLDQFQTDPLTPDSSEWYGSMVTIPLPDAVEKPDKWTGMPHPLQSRLADQHRIEVPIVKWGHRMHIRVSCQIYNTTAQIDHLCAVLEDEIR